MRVGVEDVGGGDAGGLVHPHVERGVVPVGEAAVGLVELERRDTQVEQDAHRRPLGVLGEHRGDVVVDGVHGDEALTEAGEALAGQRQGLLVAVQADDPRRGAPFQDRLGVAAHAQGAVDAHGARVLQRGLQQVDDAVAQHGDVPFGGVSSAAHPVLRVGAAVAGAVVVLWLLRVSSVVAAVGRPGGWSPSDPRPARGKSRREPGRLEAGRRVVGGRGCGCRTWGRARGVGGSGLRAPGPPPRSRRSTTSRPA